MLVRIGDYVMAHQASGIHISFLSHQLAQSLVLVKRLFDKFIVSIYTVYDYILMIYSVKCGTIVDRLCKRFQSRLPQFSRCIFFQNKPTDKTNINIHVHYMYF